MLSRLLAILIVLALCPAVSADPPDKPLKDPPTDRDGSDKKAKKKQKKKKGAKDQSGKKAGDKRGKKTRDGIEGAEKDKRRRPPTDLAIKAVRTVIENADFEDLTFEDFTEWVRRTTRANVVVRWKLLEKEGVERDYPIYIKRKHIRMNKLLRQVFLQVTEDLKSVELAAQADGNTLIISTKKDLNTKRITRAYDVQDLLVAVPTFASTISSTDPIGRRTGFSASTDPTGAAKRKAPKTDDQVQNLIDVITTHVQPLSWKVNGGKGTLAYYKGRLVVYNNIDVHQQLVGVVSSPDDTDTPGSP